jgi:hypothetical protein
MLALGYWLDEDRKMKPAKESPIAPSPDALLMGNPEPKP